MKISRATIACSICAISCLAVAAESRLQFPVNGFSIAPLEGTSDAGPYQGVIMMLPPSEGFAPNVNVQIQPYQGTLKEFAEISDKQFKDVGLTIAKEEATATTITWEYTGTYQGHPMHWYSKAIQGKGRIYLVTATALESQWESVSGKLKDCVNSFKLEAGNAPARPAA